MAVQTISAVDFMKDWQAGKRPLLLDVRTPAEYREVHAQMAELAPLADLKPESFRSKVGEAGVVLICKSGARAAKAAEAFASAGFATIGLITGGTDGWLSAGQPVVRGQAGGLSIMRQVQIIVGGGVLTGVVLALTVHPMFALLSGVFGAGLMFAGLTGTCGLAVVLAYAPWNRGCGCGKSCSV